jgi:phenylacetate-CoA ligase
MNSIQLIVKFMSTRLEEQLSRDHLLHAKERLLDLFQRTVREVPAYRDFLAEQRFDPVSVKTHEDFVRLPLLTKDNYIRAYPLPARCKGGTTRGCEMIAMSSGSTGKPLAWPRSVEHELEVSTRFEQVLVHGFGADRLSTLVVICFAMGSWVGGMYTTQCCRYLAQKGYPLTLVTPGNNPVEILRIIEELGQHFDQLVLAGYPPFLKEVVDRGLTQGLDWKRYTVKMILAGEVFSEEWRSLVCQRLGARDPAFATASLYGTADAGVLGNETPLSISIRRFFGSRPEAARTLFGESRLPTLVQYDPCSRYFETFQNTLVVSGDGGVPLLRYHIADKGGIFGYDQLLQRVKDLGGDPISELHGQGAAPLPFVYLFGRADFTVSYFGANVYPENVSVGLEQPEIRDRVSGKFVLHVVENVQRDKELHVIVETSPGIAPTESLAEAIGASIQRHLLRLNSEFANYVPPARQAPQITLRSAGDPEYFPAGVKHRYTKSS